MIDYDESAPFGSYGTIVGDWVDNVSGYRCLVLVGPVGALNGYVEVPESHPWFGVHYGEHLDPTCGTDWCWEHTPEAAISVHGGITYANTGEGFPIEMTGWWFGFDCAHAGDLVPSSAKYGGAHPDDVLRGPEWVAAETSRLAHQLAKIEQS